MKETVSKSDIAKGVVSRLRLYQTGNAQKIDVIAAFWLLNAAEIEEQWKADLAEYRHRDEWFTVSTRQAIAKLFALRGMFQYDEPAQLDLATPENPQESECRSQFFDRVKQTYPDATINGYPERELWSMLKEEFLHTHSECIGIELQKNWCYDL